MFHNILVAVDGSADADAALAHAIDLAESEHTHLTLITSPVDVPAIGFLGAGEVTAALVVDARLQAETVLRRARELVPDDLPVTTVLATEPIRIALLREIKKGSYDLVVMGSRGRGAVRAALLGSASHFVLHHSPVPVLIVHADRSAQPETYKTSVAA